MNWIKFFTTWSITVVVALLVFSIVAFLDKTTVYPITVVYIIFGGMGLAAQMNKE